MPIRRITDVQLGSISTTKILQITTSELLYTMESGNRAVEITSYSTSDIYYGGSGVLVTSGGVIAYRGSKFWDSVTDDFKLFFVNGSAGTTSIAVAQEYAGN